MSFLAELKRRNIIRAAGLYLVGAWLVVQVVGTVLPMFGAPTWVLRSIVILLAIGLVPALLISWAFEFTPEGLKRDSEIEAAKSIAPQTAKRMDQMIMAVLALALGYFAVDKFVLSPARDAARIEHARQEGRSQAIVASHGERSIAVLPFVDMSQGKDQEYFSDGIAEELLNLLAKIPELRVISRSSAFSFKSKQIDIPTIAKQLNVAHVLEGSVRKAGNRVRITVQLIEGRSDTHLWSETYDRPLDNIFVIQDEIAAAVVEQLKLTLLGAAPKARKTDPKAYALYLQARQLGRQGTAEGYEQAIALYQQVLAVDPDYAAAWNGLSSIFNSQAGSALRPVDEGFRLAREAANRALAIDPDFALAHTSLGWIAMTYDGDLAAAARHMERAQALEPANPDIIRNASILARNLGRLDQAIALDQYAVTLDPVNPAGYHNQGIGYSCAGRLDEAIASFRTSLRLSPGRNTIHYEIGIALLLKGDGEAALTAMQQEVNESWRLVGLPMAYHTLKQPAKSDAALAELIDKYEQDAAYNIAYVLAWRGEADRAFAWLDKAVAYHDPGLATIVAERLFANLHQDPRWLLFLRKLGKAPEQLATVKFKVTLPRAPVAGSASP